MALIRTAVLGGLIYFAIALSYPDWTGRTYHVTVLSLIAGGSVGVWFLHKILGLGEGAGVGAPPEALVLPGVGADTSAKSAPLALVS